MRDQRFIKFQVTSLYSADVLRENENIKEMYDSALSYPPVCQLYNYKSACECHETTDDNNGNAHIKAVSSTALSLGSLSEEETESVHTKWLESSRIFINRSITK